MSYSPRVQEVKAISGKSGAVRFEYVIKRCADFEEVWSIQESNEGWALYGDNEGRMAFPVWPAEIFAKLCCAGEWENHTPKVIALSEWMDKWLDKLSVDNLNLAIFPTAYDKGVIVSVEQMRYSLEEAGLEFE